MKKALMAAASLAALLLSGTGADARIFHVSKSGSDFNEGTEKAPFQTISKAARTALSGDTVIVHEGTYREWVSPENGGFTKDARIVYMAAPDENVYIKGSEKVEDWDKVSGSVWKTVVPNTFFGDFNPFATHIQGDWLASGSEYHLGEVYLDEKALLEKTDKEEMKKNEHTWFVECNDEETVIYANFGKADPRKSLVEINVRQACFFPRQTGMNYITVKGFHMSQAAPQWAPPTAEQQGLVGPNWSKGWIIEDCEISDSKCVGICLGTIKANGNNFWSKYEERPGFCKRGFNRQIETVLRAVNSGWSEDYVGSHLVQNNVIHDCGQSGIVGHMGGINSVFRHNEIYNINVCKAWGIYGAETAGIKLHAAIDAVIEDNVISKSTMGIWLDWESQGVHVRRNLFFGNGARDILVEVSHGPTFLYNNLFLSAVGIKLNSQGVAVFNNVVAGMVDVKTTTRYTPYHQAHSTDIKGFYTNDGGDVHFYNNLFLGNYKPRNTSKCGVGTYDDYPVYTEKKEQNRTITEKTSIKFPVRTQGNVYLYKSLPYSEEKGFFQDTTAKVKINVVKEGESYVLDTDLDLASADKSETIQVNTALLGIALIPEELFENPDGTPFELADDYYGNPRSKEHVMPGPFQEISDKVLWKK